LQQLRLHREFLKLQDPVRELRLLSAQSDELGLHHLRFQQLYEGIPIWGADLYVHIRSDGTLSLLNGRYLPTPVGAPTQPRLSPAEALERARDYVQRQTVLTPLPALPGLPSAEPSATLVLFPHPVTGAVFLCYEVNLHANLLEDYTLFVDALDGTIRWRILNTCSWHRHTSLSFPSDVSLPVHAMPRRTVAAGTFVDASGTDANGVTRSFRVYRHDDGMYYMIWDLPSLDRSGSQLPNRVKGGAVTLTANNSDIDPQNPQVYHITSPDNTWRDPVAVSAHYNAFISDRYYRTTHTRNSLDGQGGTVISIIHATYRGQPMSNAYWNGGLKIMVYGDGDGYLYKPFAAALDVAAHEMTHGVTQHTANLVYQFQPGALNESFSDVFAIMVDRDDFLLGEDLQGPASTKIATRDLANPSNPNVESPQPAHMSQYENLPIDQDNGGVHINSGIPNRAAYLIIQALGREKTERIYYRALTQYLTRSSEFIDCRRAVIRAAQELYGQAEAQAAAQAFDAVGIYDSGGGGGSGNEVPPVQGGTWYIAFILSDGRIALLETATGQASVLSTSDPRTRALLGSAGYPLSQVSTARSGSRIYFVNQQGQLAYADLAQQGFFLVSLPISNLRNACISSDGRIASIVTMAIDRSIYLMDGQQVARLPLTPQVPDGGAVNTIWLADVMAWSPNMRDPKLGFDAFNVLPLQTGDTLAYWNIYEAHFAGPAIYELVPPRPEEFSLGNITYSNTDPDIIAFNYFSHQTGVYETILANLQTGQAVALGTSQWSYQGQPLLDVQRPTFSPDNRYLAMVSPSLGLLIVADLQQGQVGALELGQPAYHPRWFAVGATSVAAAPSVSGDVWVSASAAEGIVVGYTVPEPALVWLEVCDLLGRPVLRLRHGEWRAAGRYEERITAPSLAPGLYVVRLRRDAFSTARPFVWLR
jgi:Zn-dependent metalloprotease